MTMVLELLAAHSAASCSCTPCYKLSLQDTVKAASNARVTVLQDLRRVALFEKVEGRL